MSKWIVRQLGCDVPLHFTAFHPDFKLTDIPPTPAATLSRARRIAIAEGMRYVYTGNIHDTEGGTTYCPACGDALIVRDWYEIEDYRLTPAGTCCSCATAVAGRFEARQERFGRRRIPVRIQPSA
jgi:pyruvate formate lyase activating enzyme